MNNIPKKIAIFDFCETIVRFQSADAYIKYVLKRECKNVELRHGKINSLINKVWFHFFNASISKNRLLKQLKGIDEEKLNQYANDYYEEIIVPGLIPETIEYLKKLQTEGYFIVIASAGFGIYIKYFTKE